MSVAVVIVAAGRGRRLGGEIPKQYLPLGDRTVLRISVEAFLALEAVTQVIVVLHPDDRALYETAMSGVPDMRVLPAVAGAETRAGSVRNGLEALAAHTPSKVLIHDAARPFITEKVITEVIETLDQTAGACVGVPVVDAMWRSDGAGGLESVSRDNLWRAQTPQGFRFDAILAAHQSHDGSGADDVAVAVEAGLAVTFVRGSDGNYKITTSEDYARAQEDVAGL